MFSGGGGCAEAAAAPSKIIAIVARINTFLLVHVAVIEAFPQPEHATQ
jgi:hypothetical protein